MKIKYPSPFQIAIYLTVFAFLIVFSLNTNSVLSQPSQLLIWWGEGIWSLLGFTMQMVLILLLGTMIANTSIVYQAVERIIPLFNTATKMYVFVALISVILGLLNWGIGLVVASILAKQCKEYASQNRIKISYGLLSACAYTCMMVWHAGFSGSATLTLATEGHFLSEQLEQVSINQTILSSGNLRFILFSVILIPLAAFGFSKSAIVRYQSHKPEPLTVSQNKSIEYFFIGIGFAILFSVILIIAEHSDTSSINLNTINLLLLGIAILLNRNSSNFLKIGEKSISSTFGIIIQFPIYAGIMGLIVQSGTVDLLAAALVNTANQDSLPYFSFLSAAILNCLVPSGGGQWAVQGPIIMDSVNQLQSSGIKNIMAFCYGDQVTNMVQPFWALPLLAITGVRIKDLLPYCVRFFLVGIIISVLSLLFF